MKRAIALLALTAALAAGCDDGDERDPRADFLKRADRICLKSGLRPKAVPNDLAQAAGQLSEEARLRAAVHEQLGGLGQPPPELRADWQRFLELTGAVARDLRRMAGVARAGDASELGELSRRTGTVETERQRLAARIGFRRCGRPITEPLRGG
ncbi:MAG TPA: hypothetical protein VF715_18950 [Thermoleophilaceae bacterium]|jgi:hypothetical protein